MRLTQRQKHEGYDSRTVYSAMKGMSTLPAKEGEGEPKEKKFCAVLQWHGEREPADYIQVEVLDDGKLRVRGAYEDTRPVESTHFGNYVVRVGKTWDPANDRIPDPVKYRAEEVGLDIRSAVDQINDWINEAFTFTPDKFVGEVASLNDTDVIRVAVCEQRGVYPDGHERAGKARFIPVGGAEVTRNEFTGTVTATFLDTLGVEEGEEFFLVEGEIPSPLFVPLRDNRFLPRAMEVVFGFVNNSELDEDTVRIVTDWQESGVYHEGHPKAGQKRFRPVGAVELRRSDDAEYATVTKVVGSSSSMQEGQEISLKRGSVPKEVYGLLTKKGWVMEVSTGQPNQERTPSGVLKQRLAHARARALRAQAGGPIASGRTSVKGKKPSKGGSLPGNANPHR